MKRLFRSKRAVSPVIGTVLMIMITMIGMTLLFAFVASYSQTYKAGIGSSVMESLTIEDIHLSPEKTVYDSSFRIVIYNSGKIDCNITSVYVDGLASVDVVTLNGNLNVPVVAGGNNSINLQRDVSWASGTTYTFKVSTLRGSDFELTYTAP
jgi:flagellin-like protein